MIDHRSVVIETLANSEAVLLERVATLEVLLRAALRAAIEANHHLDREQQRNRRLDDELRGLRETALLMAEAA